MFADQILDGRSEEHLPLDLAVCGNNKEPKLI